jgi:hypothetical protein
MKNVYEIEIPTFRSEEKKKTGEAMRGEELFHVIAAYQSPRFPFGLLLSLYLLICVRFGWFFLFN